MNRWESRTGTQIMRVIGQPFARRKVFCGNRLYQNKYELNELIQEAHSKGMSNPRDIWRYVRQKETALHPPRSDTAAVRRTADVLLGEYRRLVGTGGTPPLDGG